MYLKSFSLKNLALSLALTLLIIIPSEVFGQCQTLTFANPSFEGPAGAHVLPPNWNNCNGTTSDTQPGSWGVGLPPTNGSTYIGLVAIPGWQETASQFLSGCMVAGQSYTFSFDWYTIDETSTPGVCAGSLAIWGGSLSTGGSACDFSEILWQSPTLPTSTPGWTTQTITITPTQNWCALTFQAIDVACGSGSFYINIDNVSPVVNGISINPTIVNSTSCNGNGSITLAVVGATGATTFAWTPNVSTTNVASNLAPGNYSVVVTDAAGCSTTGNYTITGPPAISALITNPSPNICAGTTVNLTSTVSGGGGTNTYSWAPGGQSTANISVTPAGTTTYTLTVSDQFGCTTTTNTTINVNPSTPVTAGSNSPICIGNTINLTSTTVAGATYSWTGPNGFTSSAQNPTIPSATVAASGTYNLTVNLGGCISTSSVTVAVNSTFDATITPAGPFCVNAAAVTLTAVDAGGTWSGTGITNTSTGAFNPATAGAGTHTITYTIPGSCGDVQTTTITVNPLPTATASSNSPICIGTALNLTATTVAGATYGWTGPNGFTSAVQNPTIASAALADAGTYTLTVTLNGCTSTGTTTVVVNGAFDATINPAGPFCASNPAVTLVAVDGGGTWSGTGITNAATGTFNPATAGAGTHTITYSIAGACGDVQTTSIQVFADADATITAAGPFCITDLPVNLIGAQTGGTWSGTGITNTANGTFNPATAGIGTHTITYTINGVCGDVQTTNIIVNDTADATITPVGPFCVNASAITLSAVDAGGTWSGTGITNSSTGAFNPSVAGAGSHVITYTIGGSCGSTNSITIVINSLPTVSFTVDNALGCIPLTSTFTNTGTVGTNCNWLVNGSVASSASCASFTGTFSLPGCYDIALQTTDANGCTNSASVIDMVCVEPNPIADFTFNPDDATVLDPTIDFTNTSVGGSTYLWDFSGLGTSTAVNPSFTFPDLQGGSYNVCLNVASAIGCLDSICKIITIYDEFLIYVPNAFTPDGDGKNDYFMPIVSGHDLDNFEFLIFDRWGELIFESSSADQKWDGMHKGQKAKQDVYVWKLKAKRSSDGEKKVYYGHVSLLR